MPASSVASDCKRGGGGIDVLAGAARACPCGETAGTGWVLADTAVGCASDGGGDSAGWAPLPIAMGCATTVVHSGEVAGWALLLDAAVGCATAAALLAGVPTVVGGAHAAATQPAI